MLIKNEISFDSNGGQHNNGIIVMIILYTLSLFGCVLIGIVLLKLIITCFLTEKFAHIFTIRSEDVKDRDIDSGHNTRRRVSDISVVSKDSLQEPNFSKIENFFVKISETKFRSKQQCICPVCANDHISGQTKNSTVMDRLTVDLKKGQHKRSSFILRSAQVLSKKLILKKEKTKSETNLNEINDNNNETEDKKEIIIPIVSQTTTEKIILKTMDRPLGDIKQIANYSDVILELKQKFSTMTMINAIV